jgi:cell division protein FtsZ
MEVEPQFDRRAPNNPVPAPPKPRHQLLREEVPSEDEDKVTENLQKLAAIEPTISVKPQTVAINPTPESSESDDIDKVLDGFIQQNRNKIVAVGVGGAGCNAIDRLRYSNFDGAVTVSANTDALHLRRITSDKKIPLGLKLTQGLGAGNDPVIGKAAAEESVPQINTIVKDADMVFVTGGMGGGTGTGAAAVIARQAKQAGALTVGVCTLPFEMEGETRAKHAIQGLRELFDACDTVIVIPNEKLMELVPNLPINLAFKVADEILVRAVKGIVNLVVTPAYVNVDFADIRQVLKQGGTSVIGMGEGEGENRTEDALRESLSNSLLDIQIMDCKAALINIAGGESLSLKEVQRCVQAISQEMGEESEIIWGTHIDPSLGEKIQVTTILSGVSSPYNLDLSLDSNFLEEETINESPKIDSIWD